MRKFIFATIAIASVSWCIVSCAPNTVMTKKEETFSFDKVSDNRVEKVVSNELTNNGSVKSESGSYYQVGIASWYGREFHGRLTASGEPFDMNKLTAAHRTLPFGSVILVTNLDNGKSVQCVVNDRGPFKKDRILDLSYAAARQLDMLAKGEAKVGITVLSYGSRTQPDQSNDMGVFGATNYYNDNDSLHQKTLHSRITLQAGAFYSRTNAERLKQKIEELIQKPVTIVQEGYFYKVRIVNLSGAEATNCSAILKENNIPVYKVPSQE